jgi:hypothetical protein
MSTANGPSIDSDASIAANPHERRCASGAALLCAAVTITSALRAPGVIRPWGAASMHHFCNVNLLVSAAYTRAVTRPPGLASTFGLARLAR